MATVVLWETGFLEFDAVDFDSTTGIEWSYESDITQHPVETGESIVDNIRNKPVTVSITAMLSNIPNVTAGLLFAQRDRVITEYPKIIDALHFGKLPCSIITPLFFWENMYLESIKTTRGPNMPGSIDMVLNFKEIQQVESALVDAPTPAVSRAQKTKDGGKKGKKNTTTKKESSLLLKAGRWLF